ncbi:MAG: efflux RND transporter periplasmic adaptor subunit [Pseudomonadales bacterium]|nr:efflux RND transporter periplasmic adaptor subunit [Pseudomonadales bacterium]
MSSPQPNIIVRHRRVPYVQILLSLGLCCLAPSAVAREVEQLPAREFDCVIEPSEIVNLGTAVPGVIGSIHAERSDSVAKGELVAELESSVENVNVSLFKARAALDTAVKLRLESAAFGQRTRARNQSLLQSSSVSQQDIDKLETENRIAELQVHQEQENRDIALLEYERAKALLDKHMIRAPFAGVVMERFKSVGEYIEDDPVFRIAQLDPLNVEVILPVAYMGQFKPGQQAQVTPVLDGFTGQVATLTRVDQVADAASSTFGARLRLPNPDHAVPAGLRCRLAFLPPAAEDQDADSAIGSELGQTKLDNDFTDVPMTLAQECYRVGPFATESSAVALFDLMADLNHTSPQQVNIETEHKHTEYLVLAAGEPDEQPFGELERYLTDNGEQDFYRIRNQEYYGRLALGFFTVKENALQRQARIAGLGVDVDVVEVTRQSPGWWTSVAINSNADAQISLASTVLALAPEALVQRAECERVTLLLSGQDEQIDAKR